MLDTVQTIVGNAMLVVGAFIILSGAIGLIRLPDFYTRACAIAAAAGLGVALLLVGLLVLYPTVANLIKGVVAIIGQLVTSSIGGFALARAGYLTGARPASFTTPDHLADDAFGDPDESQRI